MPLAVVTAASAQQLIPLVVAVSLLCLVLLGALGAKAGGAPVMRSIIRVTFWGALAMALTAGVGSLRSEEHTSELQSLMRISYAVFCLKKKTNNRTPMKQQQ